MSDRTDTARRIVVVGGGPAAHRVVEALQSRSDSSRSNSSRSDSGSASDLDITVIAEEPMTPYDRVALSTQLSPANGIDGPVKSLTLGDENLWGTIDLRVGDRAVAIRPGSNIVQLESGIQIGYDELILATGSEAPIPDIPGATAPGCFVYRTVQDIAWLQAEMNRLTSHGNRPKAVVVGGGLLGLEAAGGLDKLGADVTLVHSGKWLMSSQLDNGGGQALGRLIAAQGIELCLGVRPAAIEVVGDFEPVPSYWTSADRREAMQGPPSQVASVMLADGRRLPADLVVFAIGIKPRSELALEAGLEITGRGGIMTNEYCRTMVENIWAIGEVASVDGLDCVGLVAPSNAMAEVVADRLLGGFAEFPGVDDATKLKLSGVDVASFGDARGLGDGVLEVVYADPARGLYQKLVLADDGITLLGGILVGDASQYSSLRPMVGMALPGEPAAYLAAGGAPAPSTDLPAEAVVCSCNNVTVGTVREAVRGEGVAAGCGPCQDMASLKACSRAGTQCGSCVGLVKKILEKELTSQGVSVSKALCEHFNLSRAELFEAVRITGLRSFAQIVEKFGSGRGCDICKPVIASVLASQHTEYVLDSGRGVLQDTNDRALANMQKDGTYSVVPRIPGGEITPEGLIVIGQIAADYGLYTKITGGQRIDMFGARLEQLPQIWEKLINAGFESGQAYGKSLRTVKSCVGSTWCRYGVQDSVGMAIALELRYRGLRSPHKLKFGVSGCARECAEARGKDVGIIATDLGWNIYVGGNGGFTPRHAQLLVSDVNDEQLVAIIDRFLMYYIRTADRLQRTAPWIEDLPGGLDHLREVVLQDSLGINADLEAAMAAQVENYQDEWAATLADPQRLKRFRSFVNEPSQADPGVAHVLERGQPRPATATERTNGTVLLAGTSLPIRRSAPGTPVVAR